MTHNITKEPVIRFNGYTDAWEQRKLGDMADNFEYGLNASSTTYDGVNKYIRITDIDESTRQFNSEKVTSPDVDLSTADNFILQKGDILFARTGASVGKSYLYDNKDGRVYFAGFLIRARIKSTHSEDFIFQNTLTEKYNNFVKITSQRSGQPGINAQEYSSFTVMIPKIKEEQIKIGNFFKQLDETITLQERELELLKQQKKGFLQKMFPKQNEKVPELRFEGYTDDWEQRKLGDLVEQVIREVPKPSKPYNRMSVRSHAKGTFKQHIDDPSKVAMKTLFVVKENDLVVNITFAWEHAIAIVPKQNENLLVSHRFPTYRADGKSDIKFIKYLVFQEEFRRKLELISPGGAGRNRVLSKIEFVKLNVVVPNLIEEQTKIGNFFKQLDKTITLQERKLEALKNIKKSFLQKMFV